MKIQKDDLSGAQIIQLLEEHLAHMYSITPPESVHALDIESLKSPDVTFWSAWNENTLVGCGALKSLGKRMGEIKSMRTVSTHTGKGVASYLLAHIVTEARTRKYSHLFLETGSMSEFEPARSLYEKHGFLSCPPFGEYSVDPNSAYYCMAL